MKVTIDSLCKELGIQWEGLTYEQRLVLSDEVDKQRWLKVLNEQGFVRARWRGKEIVPNETIGE